MGTIKKCFISRYDELVKEKILIDTVEVSEPRPDFLGTLFCRKLDNACRSKGYIFKYYTSSTNNEYDYEIVVY